MCKYTGSVLVNGIEWQLSAEYFFSKYTIILDSFKYPYSWPKYLRIKTFLTSIWVLLTRNKPKLDLHGVLPYTEIIIPDLGGQATALDNFGITQTNKLTQVLGENNLNLPLLINGWNSSCRSREDIEGVTVVPTFLIFSTSSLHKFGIKTKDTSTSLSWFYLLTVNCGHGDCGCIRSKL